jgi:acyl carrier protein
MNNSTEIIERFILDELMHGARKDIQPDESLLSAGVIDSVSLLRLVAFIEDKFGVQLDDEEVVLENFETIRAIETLLESKQLNISQDSP